MNDTAKNVLKFLVFVGLGFGILYLVYHNQQAAYAAECAKKGIAAADCSLVDKVIRDFRGADFGWLFLTLGAFSASNLFRAARWNMLLRSFGNEPRLDNAFLTINLGYFANLGFPRLGEIARPAAMARYSDISLERVVGTVVVGRMIDVVSLLSLTSLALYMGRDRLWAWIGENANLSRFAGLQWIALAIVVAGLLFLLLLWSQRERILATALGKKIFNIVKGFGEGLRTISRVENVPLFIAYSMGIWGMYFLMTWFVFFSFTPTAGLGAEAALITFVSGGWGIVIPSPGGMGTYHFMTQSALGLYGVPFDDSFSWANISFFTINIGCNVIIGLLALLVLPRINR